METDETVNRRRCKLLLWSFAAATLFAGCRSPDIYYWGNYENVIYGSYAHPDKVPPEAQVQKLAQDEHKALSANKPLPPGFHAHLGYAYFQLGKLDLARQEFETEKKDFPESAVFMDRLLVNLAKK
jgi:hypothetical protein